MAESASQRSGEPVNFRVYARIEGVLPAERGQVVATLRRSLAAGNPRLLQTQVGADTVLDLVLALENIPMYEGIGRGEYLAAVHEPVEQAVRAALASGGFSALTGSVYKARVVVPASSVERMPAADRIAPDLYRVIAEITHVGKVDSQLADQFTTDLRANRNLVFAQARAGEAELVLEVRALGLSTAEVGDRVLLLIENELEALSRLSDKTRIHIVTAENYVEKPRRS